MLLSLGKAIEEWKQSGNNRGALVELGDHRKDGQRAADTIRRVKGRELLPRIL